MTNSDSPTPDRPVFQTPDPDLLQSEENHEIVRDRYLNQPEADVSNSDSTNQGESDHADEPFEDDESRTLFDRQTGIIGRSSG